MIRHFAGNKITGTQSDRLALGNLVLESTTFYETDTGKIYIYTNNAWKQLGGSSSIDDDLDMQGNDILDVGGLAVGKNSVGSGFVLDITGNTRLTGNLNIVGGYISLEHGTIVDVSHIDLGSIGNFSGSNDDPISILPPVQFSREVVFNYGDADEISSNNIVSHITNSSLHRQINDSTTSSTSLWSSQKISTELAAIDTSGGSLLSADNTWTGTNTFTKSITTNNNLYASNYSSQTSSFVHSSNKTSWWRIATSTNTRARCNGLLIISVDSGNGSYGGTIVASVSFSNSTGAESKRISILSTSKHLATTQIRVVYDDKAWGTEQHIDLEVVSGSTTTQVRIQYIKNSVIDDLELLSSPIENPSTTGLAVDTYATDKETFYDLKAVTNLSVGSDIDLSGTLTNTSGDFQSRLNFNELVFDRDDGSGNDVRWRMQHSGDSTLQLDYWGGSNYDLLTRHIFRPNDVIFGNVGITSVGINKTPNSNYDLDIAGDLNVDGEIIDYIRRDYGNQPYYASAINASLSTDDEIIIGEVTLPTNFRNFEVLGNVWSNTSGLGSSGDFTLSLRTNTLPSVSHRLTYNLTRSSPTLNFDIKAYYETNNPGHVVLVMKANGTIHNFGWRLHCVDRNGEDLWLNKTSRQYFSSTGYTEITPHLADRILHKNLTVDGEVTATKFIGDGSGLTNLPGGGGGSSTLAGLSDVTLTSLANNHSLFYNSSTSQWTNRSPANARSALGLTGDNNTTHYHDTRYYTIAQTNTLMDGKANLTGGNVWGGGTQDFVSNTRYFGLGTMIEVYDDLIPTLHFRVKTNESGKQVYASNLEVDGTIHASNFQHSSGDFKFGDGASQAAIIRALHGGGSSDVRLTPFDLEYHLGNNVWKTLSQILNELPSGGGGNVTTKNISSTTYTLVLDDASSKYLRFSAGATITVPNNSSVAFPVGSIITLRQIGSVDIKVVPDTNVVINGFGDSPGRHRSMQLIKVGTNEWDIEGGIEI